MKKKKLFNTNNGFTLIEVLIVTAIIGILASIILVNLRDAERAARDASIKGAIYQAKREAEVFHNDFGDYNGVCNEPEFIAGGIIEQSIADNHGSFSCGDDIDGFCVSSTFNLGGSVCVDASGEVIYDVVCFNAADIICD